MKVKQEQVISLLKELNMPTADKWPTERLEKKIQSLPKLVKEEELEAKTADGKKLLKLLITAVNKNEEITISTGGSKEKAETKAPAKEEKKSSKKAPKEEAEESDDESGDDDEEGEDEESDDEDSDDDSGDDEESESEDDEDSESDDEESEESDDEDSEEESDDEESDDEEEEEKKPSKKDKKSDKSDKKEKKGPPKSAGGDGKPGIIASIVEFLEAATEESPISKKGMVKKLAKRFPDRNADSMAKTVNVQVPNRIKKDKGLNVCKNDKNQYWISGKLKKNKE